MSRVSSLYLWLKAGNKIQDNPVIYRNIQVSSSQKDKDMLTHTRHNRTIKKRRITCKRRKRTQSFPYY